MLGAPAALWRVDGTAWTISDVPLLGELVDLLGPAEAIEDADARGRRSQTDYAAGVLEILQTERQDLMDDEDHLLAQDLLEAEDLAGRFVEQDTRSVAEQGGG